MFTFNIWVNKEIFDDSILHGAICSVMPCGLSELETYGTTTKTWMFSLLCVYTIVVLISNFLFMKKKVDICE